MHIVDLFNKKKPVVSFEIFPPKPDYPVDTVFNTLEKLKDLSPDFISVTYGAGGSNRERTVEIASTVKNRCDIECLSHLTCVCSSHHDIDLVLEDLKKNNIENILALRGDIPQGYSATEAFTEFQYASDLVKHIKANTDCCIAAAAYPEGHIESNNIDKDIEFLKQKVNIGVDFLITQLFFDNALFYGFREKVLQTGIKVPISVGIMPVLNANQIKRITTLCGAAIPTKLAHIIAKYGDHNDDFEKAGIEYASNQVQDLLQNNVDGVHLYTMNKPEQITQIMHNCGL